MWRERKVMWKRSTASHPTENKAQAVCLSRPPSWVQLLRRPEDTTRNPEKSNTYSFYKSDDKHTDTIGSPKIIFTNLDGNYLEKNSLK